MYVGSGWTTAIKKCKERTSSCFVYESTYFNIVFQLLLVIWPSSKLQTSGIQHPELENRDGEKKPPIIHEEAVNDLLHHLDTHKPMGPD